jgi:hypothetical protein
MSRQEEILGSSCWTKLEAGASPGDDAVRPEEAHRDLRISPAEFDEVATELGRTLDFFKVPQREKGEVLAAFAVTAGKSRPPSPAEALLGFLGQTAAPASASRDY